MITVPTNIKGLIFDCDGTLVDSMLLHRNAWAAALETYGGKYDEEYFLTKRGMKETEIVEEYNEHFGTTLNVHGVVTEKHRLFMSHIHEVQPIRVVTSIAEQYHGKLPMAVVSGSVREIVMKELHVIGIAHLFSHILTGDDPFPQKPAPDLFREAARLIGIPTTECQVFEDGDLGLLGAERAGMLATDIRPFL
ncbi:MAG: HAD-IA family hydrolase [Bacteroidetes bacterium]|nr:HAD-IA family hydrolase [Bacteroidota bacterium]